MPNLRITILSGERAGEQIDPEHDLLLVGRAESCPLRLLGASVSLEHCRFVVGSKHVKLEDLESEQGTFLVRDGSERNVALEPHHAVRLRDGDMVRLGVKDKGSAELRVTLLADEEPAHVVAVRPIASLGKEGAPQAKSAELLHTLAEVHSELGATEGLDAALTVIADAALKLVPRATHATLVLSEAPVDTAGNDTVAAYVPVLTRLRDKDGNLRAPEGQLPVTRSVFRKVIRERAAVLAADAPSETFSSESLLGANIKSTIGVPLWHGDAILGVLQVDNRDRPALFDGTDVDALGILATNASLTLDNARLIQRLIATETKLKRENQYLKGQQNPHEIVGQSQALSGLMAQLKKVADTRVTVLIEGETGTGKELIAAALHNHSRRSQRLMVAQNCAAVPRDLLESELFGHRRGAFTGASEDKRGLFEIADGGTLFLDEISELPLVLQAKLLRVLQEREIRPLGGTRDKKVDVRVVAACNRSLEAEVRAGRFREDLYYRLNVFPLKVPPLRERRSDIPLLCKHFLARYTREYGNPVPGFSAEALAKLTEYDWPGNVRELENEVQRLVIQTDAESFVPAALLSDKIRGDDSSRPALPTRPKGTLKQVMDQFERHVVSDALQRHQNNKTQAAKSLGITREGLHKKLKQLGID